MAQAYMTHYDHSLLPCWYIVTKWLGHWDQTRGQVERSLDKIRCLHAVVVGGVVSRSTVAALAGVYCDENNV